MNILRAEEISAIVIRDLTPFVKRIEVAGSVRRKKTDGIKDVELVILPDNRYLNEIMAIVNNKYGNPIAGRFPAKYTKIRSLYDLDLFFANEKNWGMIYFIRTGGADFVKRALAHWKKITNGGYCHEGILYTADNQPVDTFEESDVFKALKCSFINPEKRR